MFKHEPCSCAEGVCIKGVAPASDCVNRLSGTVEAVRCEKCNGETLHHNGECIRCQRLASSPKESIPKTSSPSRQETRVSLDGKGLISLAITFGGGQVVVTEKKRVAKILKILLED